MTSTRLEAFSDGVLAIIITIMVLELKVPHGTEWSELAPIAPKFISYVLSFLFVGIYWGNHHHLLHTVKHVEWKIIWSNNLLLFFLSMVPFTTAWMGENHFARTTVILYAVNLLLCGFGFSILQIAIQREHPGLMKDAFKKLNRKGFISLAGYSASIGIAFFNTLFSAAIFAAVAMMWIIPDRNIEKAIVKDESE